jgi:hypothetical protein
MNFSAYRVYVGFLRAALDLNAKLRNILNRENFAHRLHTHG